MTIFQPESAPHQIWILTERFVTVVNNRLGVSATLPFIAFNTELHKRGFFQKAKEKDRGSE